MTGSTTTRALAALALLVASAVPAPAAVQAIACKDPEPLSTGHSGPRTAAPRPTLSVEIDIEGESMRVDERVGRLKEMPDRYVSMGPLTRAGGIAHYDYLVIDRRTYEARAGEMTPEGMAYGVVRYRCEAKAPPGKEAAPAAE